MIAVPHYIAPDEYLNLERQSPIRHEYRQGLVYAMAGGSDNHDRIAFNLLKLIDNHLGDDADCRFHGGNVKVNYQDAFYYYPDAFVTCDPRDRRDRHIKRYPKLIAAVLSSSTEAFDRGDKFEDYQQLDTFVEYVLIAQNSPAVECRRRNAEGIWDITHDGPSDQVVLTSLGLAFNIAALYCGLER